MTTASNEPLKAGTRIKVTFYGVVRTGTVTRDQTSGVVFVQLDRLPNTPKNLKGERIFDRANLQVIR